VLGNREAQLEVNLAFVYLQQLGSNDMGDPCYMKAYAPILVELEGAMAALIELLSTSRKLEWLR
jgi:hypothetical protein